MVFRPVMFVSSMASDIASRLRSLDVIPLFVMLALQPVVTSFSGGKKGVEDTLGWNIH